MTKFNKMLGGLTVAVFGFAMTASAATIMVTDEFGTPITDGRLTVQSWDQAGLSANLPESIAATELRGGGYQADVSGPALITFEHTAYGVLHSKANLGADITELVINSDGAFFGMGPLGLAPKAAGAVAKAACPASDDPNLTWAAITAPGGATTSGTTSGNNFGVNCGVNGSEQFHRYTAGANGLTNHTTCLASNPQSLAFDTVLQVRDSACAGNLGCSDDSCAAPQNFASTVNNVAVTNGVSYQVQIDNWASTASLNYDLNVGTPFELDPPEGGCIDENEPNCGLDPDAACAALDTVNGGCNFSPPLFSPVACGETYCSTAGNCGNTRDTDWYQFTETSIQISSWCCIGEFTGLYGFVATNGGPSSGQCPAAAFLAFGTATAGNEVCIEQLTYPGIWTTFGATANFAGDPCGVEYQCTLSCVCPASCGGSDVVSSTSLADGGFSFNDGRER